MRWMKLAIRASGSMWRSSKRKHRNKDLILRHLSTDRLRLDVTMVGGFTCGLSCADTLAAFVAPDLQDVHAHHLRQGVLRESTPFPPQIPARRHSAAGRLRTRFRQQVRSLTCARQKSIPCGSRCAGSRSIAPAASIGPSSGISVRQRVMDFSLIQADFFVFRSTLPKLRTPMVQV